jgi:hypothetical protein
MSILLDFGRYMSVLLFSLIFLLYILKVVSFKTVNMAEGDAILFWWYFHGMTSLSRI